jgi:hypothetical protein
VWFGLENRKMSKMSNNDICFSVIFRLFYVEIEKEIEIEKKRRQ